MKSRALILLCLAACALLAMAAAPAPGKGGKADSETPMAHNANADTMRVQGEQRFRANCARCHAAPQKFNPRMMATVLRHMRVRAGLTEEDTRTVLFYMTQ